MSLIESISSWDLGTVPEWIAAIGTLAAVFWAVFLYRRSIQDHEIAQARRLSIISDSSGHVARAGEPMEEESAAFSGVKVSGWPIFAAEPSKWLIQNDCWIVAIRFISTSDETLTIEDVVIRDEGGTDHDFFLPSPILEPHADRMAWGYYNYFFLVGDLGIKVRFRDASGKYWVHETDRPVRPLARRAAARLKGNRVANQQRIMDGVVAVQREHKPEVSRLQSRP